MSERIWTAAAILASGLLAAAMFNLAGLSVATYHGVDDQNGIILIQNGIEKAGCEYSGVVGCWLGDAS